MIRSQSPSPTIPPMTGTVVLAGAAFGVPFAPAFWYVMTWLPPRFGADYLSVGLIALASGGLFGLLLALFLGSKTVARQTALDLPAGETLEQQGWANHFMRIEARGGRLYLTNRNLIFQPHKFNLQSTGVVIPRAEIANASKCMTLWVLPNGLMITRRDGTKERFVVSDRKDWIRRIAQGADSR